MSATTKEGNVLDVLRGLPTGSVHLAVSSSPYFPAIRKYAASCDVDWPSVTYRPMPIFDFTVTVPAWYGQLGSEDTVEAFVAHMVLIYRELYRVMRDDGLVWTNLGDSFVGGNYRWGGDKEVSSKQLSNYGSLGMLPHTEATPIAGLATGNLIGVPAYLALALQAEGWVLRAKPPWIKVHSGMPGSQLTRPTLNQEDWLMLTKQSSGYYFDPVPAMRKTSEAAIVRADYVRNPDNKTVGGAPGQSQHSFHTPGRKESIAELRMIRSGDWVEDSIGEAVFELDEYARYLAHFEDGGNGMLLDTFGNPLALCFPTQPSKEAHYATYPPRMIKEIVATSSPSQCCEVCGKGWRRVWEKRCSSCGEWLDVRLRTCPACGEEYKNTQKREPAHVPTRNDTKVDSTGWSNARRPTTTFQPACKCGSEGTAKSTVLDIFAGSGTTLLVAEELRRNSIGIDADPANIAIMQRRLDTPYIAPPPIRKKETVLPLFAGIE